MEEQELTEKIIGCAMKVHSVLGPGFSPRSVALQCANLKRFLSRRPPRVRKARLKPIPDFQFGGAMVSPERRLLRARARAGGAVTASCRRGVLKTARKQSMWFLACVAGSDRG